MIISLPFQKLPLNFTRIVSTNLYQLKDSDEFILNNLEQDKAVAIIGLMRTMGFSDVSSFDEIFKNQGWNYIRDKLAMLYLSKKLDGHYPDRFDLTLIEDLLLLEQEFQLYSVEGFSRIFLLGFYLKFCEIVFNKKNPGKEVALIKSTINSLKLIPSFERRALKLDWFILINWQFNEFLGTAEYLKIFKQDKKDYHCFYSALSPSVQKLFTQNMLNYALSIQDFEMIGQIQLNT